MPGEKLVIKLWETVAEKGIGGLFRPWQIRREGRASIELKREELLTIAQAERDAELIRRGEQIPSFVLPQISYNSNPSPVPSIEQRAAETTLSDTIRREANVTRALLYAEQVLETEEQAPPEEAVNDDWLFRWRDSASQVSSEELQNLWGRVLAGEVKSPGSYSLRTLEFIKNISKDEAEAIAKLSQFVIGGSTIYRGDNEDLDEFGINFNFLLNMQHLGVISGVEALGMTTTWKSIESSKFTQSFTSNSMVLIVTADDPSHTISAPTYLLTAIGAQVLSLGTFETNLEYLKKVAEHFKKQGVSVKLAKYIRVTPTTIKYFEAQEL
ncbi:DUF2806 domain-containing protein [Xanthomonas arboricola]|uniref:DUF2806 domain-containing protein n=1 Tax=Xanthomonas arboricola TaxID=56448 RepID=UPI001E351841|nr:DUF2806 domain-containing protein [Xanthomonas arboricola]